MRNRYESAIACEAVVLRQIYTIILNQCIKHPKREIIEFIDGPKWNFHDL